MEVQRQWLFGLDDGGNLSFAVHDEVPYRERLCEAILQNGGALLDWQAADFVILSTSIPGFDELAAFLNEHDRVVVHDHWVRASIDAQRVLPWYEDQIVPSSSKGDTSESSRDFHELVVCLARYSPVLSDEAIYNYLARRSPHKTFRDFRLLHHSRQAEVDSQVIYLRFRINSALSSAGTFVKRPKMGFTISAGRSLSPIRPPIAAIDAAASMPTPVSLARASSIERRMSVSYQSPVDDRAESPCPFPNLERTPPEERQEQIQQQETPSSSSTQPSPPQPRGPSERIKERTKSTKGSDKKSPTKAAKSRFSPKFSPKKGGRYPGERVMNFDQRKAGGKLFTHEDKMAMAQYILRHPKRKGNQYMYWGEFSKGYHRGGMRTASAWEAGFRRHQTEISGMLGKTGRSKRAHADDINSLSSLDTNLGL